MTKRRKILTWVGLYLSLPVAGYAGGSFIFYLWQSAANPERWPSERAGVWAFEAIAVALIFLACLLIVLLALFVKQIGGIVRKNKQHNPPVKGTRRTQAIFKVLGLLGFAGFVNHCQPARPLLFR